MSFALHPKLAEDGATIGDFPLCRLLLMKDAGFPWCILVPRRENVREIYELAEADQQQLQRESVLLGRGLMDEFRGDKLNVAALGNVVPQLHLHHIVRYRGDPAWPAPVWGRFPAKPYADAELAQRLQRLRARFGAHLEPSG